MTRAVSKSDYTLPPSGADCVCFLLREGGRPSQFSPSLNERRRIASSCLAIIRLEAGNAVQGRFQRNRLVQAHYILLKEPF
jgi:hypothetical protein